MTTEQTTETHRRIMKAAGDLLARGGRKAVTTRAVSAAAGVQAPAIYRQFGDMRGLLDAVARETLAAYVREKAVRARTTDPVEDLRSGWDLHVAFGLANPDAYALLFGDPFVTLDSAATREAYSLLMEQVGHVAEAGRLRVDVAQATRLLHAAGNGVTLTLIGTAPAERDPKLSESMREAILAAITIAAPVKRAASDPERPGERVAVHAVALRARLGEASGVLTAGEEQLFREWLDRLARASADGRGGDKTRGKRSAEAERPRRR
jgi:AcrR family transcriptional regulator